MGLFDSNTPSLDYTAILNGAGSVLQGAAPYLGSVIGTTSPVSAGPSVGTNAPVAPAPAPSSPSGTPASAPGAPVAASASSGTMNKGVIIGVVALLALFVAFAPK